MLLCLPCLVLTAHHRPASTVHPGMMPCVHDVAVKMFFDAPSALSRRGSSKAMMLQVLPILFALK